MSRVIFERDNHRVVVFNDLVRGDDGVQANQFLIQHGDRSALFDPGGALLYTPLTLALSRYLQPRDLTYIFASHQDPDIIGAVDRWLMYTDATVVCSKLWGRFVPHSVPHYQKNTGTDRYLLLGDEGGRVGLGDHEIIVLPAHFLHSVGNFSFYDPTSRVLLSGDVGSSIVAAGTPYVPVEDFGPHMPSMRGFHRRYMGSRRVARLWVAMVRELDPEWIVPQHGLPLRGAAIRDFLAWLEDLECGTDLLGSADFRIPARAV